MTAEWQQLGELGPCVLGFGGPYSNLQATQALLARAGEMGIAPSACICTGDLVAYGADPAATIAAIRSAGCVVIAGNCERQIADGQNDCGCGFDPGTTCDAASGAWFAHARSGVDAGARNWMAGLPCGTVFSLAGCRYAVLHGGATRINRFLWPTSPAEEFREEIAAVARAVGPVDGILAGHCGIAFHRNIDGVDWINAGAIGLPPHDGRPETRFAVLTAEGLVLHRLKYDAQAARAAMESVNLTQGYHETLSSGIWPDEGILPVELRR